MRFSDVSSDAQRFLAGFKPHISMHWMLFLTFAFLLSAVSYAQSALKPSEHKVVSPIAPASAAPVGQITTGATAQKPITVPRVVSGPNVQLYLKTGDVVRGQLMGFVPQALVLKTPQKGLRAYSMYYYQGLVLDTPEEYVFGTKIGQDETMFSETIAYAQKARPMIEQQLQSALKGLPDVCKPKSYPVFHIRLHRSGKVLQSQLIARSNCPHLNLAMAQAVKKVQFQPLPKDYPLEIYVLNYFYPQSLIQQAVPKAQEPTQTQPSAKISPPVAMPSPKPVTSTKPAAPLKPITPPKP